MYTTLYMKLAQNYNLYKKGKSHEISSNSGEERGRFSDIAPVI